MKFGKIAIAALLLLPTAFGYSFHRSITIDHTKVGSSDSTNFPVLFAGTYSYLALASSGGKVQSSSGYDIKFTFDSGGVTNLSFERELWVSTTGQVVFWVKVPTVSHTVDTVIYLWYGDASVSSDPGNHTAVWDSNFGGVFHLPNGSTLSAIDSTSNANNGTVSGPSAASGQIDGGASISGSNKIILPANSSMEPSSAITTSMWINTAGSNSNAYFFDTDIDGTNVANDGVTFQLYSGALYWSLGANRDEFAYSYTFDSNWHYFSLTYDGSSTLTLYIDGVSKATASASGSTTWSSNGIYLGHSHDPTFGMSGTIDEFRLSSAGRSADWIKTEYNNQSSPGTFYSVGSEIGSSHPYGYPIIGELRRPRL